MSNRIENGQDRQAALTKLAAVRASIVKAQENILEAGDGNKAIHKECIAIFDGLDTWKKRLMEIYKDNMPTGGTYPEK